MSKVKRQTLEKHAPMCTLGVGGNPLLGGLGGVCLRRCFLGGTGGLVTKSGTFTSWFCFVSAPTSSLKKITGYIKWSKYWPLFGVRSVLELSLSDRWRWPLMFIELTNPKISSTDECRLGDPFRTWSSTGLDDVCTSHFASESCTGNVALQQLWFSKTFKSFQIVYSNTSKISNPTSN